MSYCQFEPTATADRYGCRRCGRTIMSPHAAERLVALCPLAADRPPDDSHKLPGWSTQLWNVTAALAAFVADGCRTVTAEEYAARLAICDPCPERADDRCGRCGCRLAWKARAAAWTCPLGKWKTV